MSSYIRVAMIVPAAACIYTPSRLSPGLVEREFTKSPIRGMVSFAPDGLSDPIEMDFYGAGMDCWYIRVSEIPL